MVLCCLVAALATAATAGAAPPLIAQYPLSESSVGGGVEYTPDVSGNGLDLEATPGSMHFGTAEGKFGGYLAAANSTNLQVNSPLLAPQQLTLLAWIKENGDPGPLRYIAGRGDDGPTCGGSSYALYTGYPGNGGLHFYVRQPGPTAVPVLSEPAPDSMVFDGKWHLVAGTFDGSNVRFYVDGNQIGPAMPASGISYEAPIGDSPFYVDGYPPQATCAGSSDFPGSIDEVRVYSRALSPTELGRLAAAPGPAAPDLVPDGAGGSPPPAPTPVGPTPGPVSLSLGTVGGTAKTGYNVLHLNTGGPVLETKLKINGSTAFNINPNAPYVGLTLGAGTHTVTATAIGANGSTATSTTTVTTPSGSFRRPAWMPEVATASSEVALFTEAIHNQECVPDTTVVFGIAEVEGCLRKIDPATELPKSEQAVGEEYGAVNFFIEHAQPLPCHVEDPTCHSNFATAFRTNPSIQPFASPKPVKINGLVIEPVNGASVVVFPAIQRVICSKCQMYYESGGLFGRVPVKPAEAVNLDLSSGLLKFSDGSEGIRLLNFNTSQAFDDIGGFPINGTVQVVMQKKAEERTTSLKVSVSLPEELTTAANANPTSHFEINSSDKRGLYLGELNIHMDEAFLGPVEITNVDFTYKDGGEPSEGCPRKWWKATAEVHFIPGEGGGGIRMAPEPRRNGIAFCAGDFDSAGAEIEFGEPPSFLPAPEIFPGVTLNDIGFGFQLREPVLFEGHAEIRSGDIIHATGGLLAVFASPSSPYTFAAGDAKGAFPMLTGQTYNSTTFAIGGTVSLVPAEDVSLELGSAYLLYSWPNYIKAAGSAHLQTFLFTVKAGGEFEINLATHRFNAGVKGEICLVGGVEVEHVGLCAGGEGHISSRGMSVCFDIGDGLWTPGVGVLYSDPIPEFFAGAVGDGCKPSHFWEENVQNGRRPFAGAARGAAHASAAGGEAMQFTVKPGEEDKTIELTGAGGAPVVTVSAPGGETLTSKPNLLNHTEHLGAISYEKYDRTWITIEGGKPGAYKVTPQPGSPPVSNVMATRPEPEAEVKATVTGSGRHLVLHYDAGHAAGQTVSFFERGKQNWTLLKKVSGGQGQIAFEPAFGPAGKRSVAGQVEVEGIPGALETLTHFKAPAPPKVARVANVRVVRHGSTLAVSWQKSPYALGYAIVTDQSGGPVHTLKAKPNHSTAKVKNVSPTEAGTVEVVALGFAGERGQPGKAKFAALRKPKTRLLPYKELGTGAPAKGNGKKA